MSNEPAKRGGRANRDVRGAPFALAKGILHRFWRVTGHGVHAPRAATTAALAGFGVLLLLLSWAAGVSTHVTSSRNWTVDHETGFLYAPNWSITAVAIWPAMFYSLRALVDGADLVFRDIDNSPMAWMAADEPGQTIGSTWARHKRILRRFAVVALALATIWSVAEWWGYSGSTLLCGSRPAEYDWSAVPATDGLGPGVQAGFALLAFLYQGIAVALMLTFAATTILMARTMGLHGSGEERPPLLVDIESNDPSNRVGFERFMIVIDYMIVFVTLGFANFFLTRIQNAYLRDKDSASLLDFVQQDFLVREVDKIPELFQKISLDLSSLAVAVGAVIGLFQCFFFFNATLRHSALQARNRSDHVLIRKEMLEKARESGLDVAGIREKLRSANVWPLGYSDLMPTLSFLAICLITILFYRVGIYFVFLWIAGWIVARAASVAIKRN